MKLVTFRTSDHITHAGVIHEPERHRVAISDTSRIVA